MDFKKDFSVSKESNSSVKISGEIPVEELEKHRAASIAAISKKVKVDGFRPGHIPAAVVVKQVGEYAVLTEMAERAIGTVYPEIIKAHQIDALGYPKLEITKIAPGNTLGFSATVAVLPEIKLPDYKKLAKEANTGKEKVKVTDADVDKQVEDILRQKAAYERLQKKAQNGEGETHTHADGTIHDGAEHSENEKPSQLSESDNSETQEDKPIEDIKDLPVPKLTDEVVKGLGQPGQFENVADFKVKLREHLEIEKKREAEAKHRAALTDKIIEESEFELPEVLIESELSQMFAQMEEDIKRAGLSVEDYLSHMKKTRDDLKKEWLPTAEKRARLQLVLNEIAKAEKVEPDKERLEQETKHLLEQYKDANETRVRVYVASVLQNEAVMKFLESQ